MNMTYSKVTNLCFSLINIKKVINFYILVHKLVWYNTKKIKVLIVDDHKIVSEGIKIILENLEDIKVVGERENGLEAIKFVAENSVDVGLMDIDMPILNGIEVTNKIISNNQLARICNPCVNVK